MTHFRHNLPIGQIPNLDTYRSHAPKKKIFTSRSKWQVSLNHIPLWNHQNVQFFSQAHISFFAISFLCGIKWRMFALKQFVAFSDYIHFEKGSLWIKQIYENLEEGNQQFRERKDKDSLPWHGQVTAFEVSLFPHMLLYSREKVWKLIKVCDFSVANLFFNRHELHFCISRTVEAIMVWAYVTSTFSIQVVAARGGGGEGTGAFPLKQTKTKRKLWLSSVCPHIWVKPIKKNGH